MVPVILHRCRGLWLLFYHLGASSVFIKFDCSGDGACVCMVTGCVFSVNQFPQRHDELISSWAGRSMDGPLPVPTNALGCGCS